ncbi:hypothetical protein JHK85_004623 [Glycine max]|nr:hypothetical protein JHK85_004623 [Glycine max]
MTTVTERQSKMFDDGARRRGRYLHEDDELWEGTMNARSPIVTEGTSLVSPIFSDRGDFVPSVLFHSLSRDSRRRDLIPSSKSKSSATSTECFSCSLNVEVHRDPGEHVEVKGRGMGRIQPLQSSGMREFDGEVEKIQGFDFANWLKKTVSKNDFVVMKMDVEGTEFDLIPRLIKTGAICLIDDIFLECHYNRWQRCCPGQRSAKYEKTYDPCLQLFKSLRQSGVLVHQWF